MSSFRSSRGGRANKFRKRDGKKDVKGGGGGDYRWKKAAGKRKRERSSAHETGDSIQDDDFAFSTESELNVSSGDIGGGKKRKESTKAIKERQRNAKRRRREMHEHERETSDEMIRTAPEQFLWGNYTEWAGSRLSTAEKKAERWSKEQVQKIEERENKSLIEYVKEVLGADYIAQGAWKSGATAKPGVACIVLASSAVRAVELAKSVYDGRPVGKLFSKHIKIEVQREWLATCCAKGLAPSAAGTAKRLQRLVEEGDMTLKHTVALIIDLKRDNRERNILDFNTSRHELFELLHNHARQLINEGKMKVLLLAPTKSELQREGVIDDEVQDNE